ncbi:hypothetical protein RFF05_14245 [Bengtsoniella intestinalis]|uniref:hypothetical protein n=1 Tax=Bengtsoniella intestinalis TaxID=3073143 RepID=UPI00391FB6A6
MNLKELLLGSHVKGDIAQDTSYQGSIQRWLPIHSIVDGVVITKDKRFIKILEVLPLNFYLKPESERETIIASYAAFLKIAPNTLQVQVITQKADMSGYIKRMEGYAQKEDTPECQSMIEDNLIKIGELGQSHAMTHRFFIIFQYEPQMRPLQPTAKSIAKRVNEEADTLKRYLDYCGLEVLEPRYADNSVLELLYERICKTTSRRTKLPAGVFDMITRVHGIYVD